MNSILSRPPGRRCGRAAAMMFALGLALSGGARAAEPAVVDLKISGPWTLEATAGTVRTTLQVTPPEAIEVRAERLDALPVFNPKAGGWIRGAQLKGVQAQETTTPFLLDPASLVVRTGPGADTPILERGREYDADLQWGTLGRTAGSALREGQTVFASYRYFPLRLDSIVLTAAGTLEFRRGSPKSAAPKPPVLAPGETRLANLWLPGKVEKLEPKHLFPILAARYPDRPLPEAQRAAARLPKTYRKLTEGGALRILAWGDSVTDGGYVPNPATERWQEQFVTRLRQAFPKASIELVTVAWGGRNTASFLAEPPGSPHNYQEKVLDAKPDLIVSEFVNDAGLNPDQVRDRYGKLLADFQQIGAEWLILTPHYVRPDWMGLDRERDIDDDPRPYVAGLRAFAASNPVGLADASLRYGHLWREGIPYTTLMLNSINHPDAQGMALFADALMDVFRGR